jgi:hypothetical protein
MRLLGISIRESGKSPPEGRPDAGGQSWHITFIVPNDVLLGFIKGRLQITIGRIVGDHSFGASGCAHGTYVFAGTQYHIIKGNFPKFGYRLGGLQEPRGYGKVKNHLKAGVGVVVQFGFLQILIQI